MYSTIEEAIECLQKIRDDEIELEKKFSIKNPYSCSWCHVPNVEYAIYITYHGPSTTFFK